MTPKIGYTLVSTLPTKSGETGQKHYSLELCQNNLETGLDNLVYFYLAASEEERLHGLQWFAQTYSDCKALAALYNLPLEVVIDVIAVVSPQLAWSHNLYAGEMIIRYFVSGAFVPSYTPYLEGKQTYQSAANLINLPIDCNVTGVNKIKALWILQGQRWALHGSKVTSFADNIRRFADSNLVTVDSHAISAWFGCVEQQSVTITPSFYAIVESDYRRAALLFGISPLECQAIVWIVKRRLSGSDKRHKETKRVDRS